MTETGGEEKEVLCASCKKPIPKGEQASLIMSKNIKTLDDLMEAIEGHHVGYICIRCRPKIEQQLDLLHQMEGD